jgi:hypothetical protein
VERFSRVCRSPCALPRRGRSAPFADPSLTAAQARHVWLPESGVSTLSAYASEPANYPKAQQELVFIPAIPSVEHILIDAGTRQHVVLRGNRAAIQLTIAGADITAHPVALTILVRGIGAIGRACDQLDTLRRILSPAQSHVPADPAWTTRTVNLRDALITFDGRRAGASHREIATFIHGARKVAEGWDSGLRERMQRNYKRGAQFVAGGYRNFLR